MEVEEAPTRLLKFQQNKELIDGFEDIWFIVTIIDPVQITLNFCLKNTIKNMTLTIWTLICSFC